MTIERALLSASVAALVSSAISAGATEAGPPIDEGAPLAPPPEPDTPPAASASQAARAVQGPELERAFSFVRDPGLAPAWQVFASYGASYSSTGAATRPLAALASRGGLVNELGAELGLHERISLHGSVLLAPPARGESSGQAAGQGSLRALVTNPGAEPFRLALGAGYARDFSGVSLPFAEATGRLDLGRVRLGGLVHAEKPLAEARDAVDLYAAAGVSVRTVEVLRLGVEYVGQDFEEAWEREEAEGGVRHFAGATFALEPSARLRLTGGPALGLSARSPRWLGRISMTYAF
jgi:hypothetical protein